MNRVRIVKPNRGWVSLDVIEVKTDLTAKEVAVLVGMSNEEWQKLYWKYDWFAVRERNTKPEVTVDFMSYLRSHIQTEIKRQGASK